MLERAQPELAASEKVTHTQSLDFDYRHADSARANLNDAKRMAVMSNQVRSKQIHGATDLTLVADIKPGLAPIPDSMSYATRLARVLNAFFEQRRYELETRGIQYGLVEQLRIIRSFRWSILGQGRQLMLAVTFDGPWEPYIRVIAEEAGPLLDLIFSHCSDYEGNSCEDGYSLFADWVRARQVESIHFYDAAPELSVDDLRYLQKFEAIASSSALDPARLAVQARNASLSALSPERLSGDFFATQASLLFRLRKLFSGPDEPQLFDRLALLLIGARLDDVRAEFANGGSDDERVATRAWVNQLSRSGTRARPVLDPDTRQVPEETVHALENVPGNVLSSYQEACQREQAAPHGFVGAAALVRFGTRANARQFLRAVRPLLSSEQEVPTAARGTQVSLGLSYLGLRSLQLSAETLARFPAEFREGAKLRAASLGDVGENHASTWERPLLNFELYRSGEDVPARERALEQDPDAARFDIEQVVDAVVLLQRPAAAENDQFGNRHPLFEQLLSLESAGVEILHVLPLRSYGDGGHFQLKDGLSQPQPRSPDTRGVHARDRVALGEILIGYQNELGQRPSPGLEAHFANSTFLALRKMEQDVAGFRAASAALNDNVARQRELLGGSAPNARLFEQKLLGRAPDGTAALPAGSSGNDFDYGSDPDGAKCPLFSHVRRANPRTERTINGIVRRPPRIVRRGLSYGASYEQSPDDTSRGVMFGAYCASLAEQFEVVQRWVNGGNSSTGSSAHPDLIAGTFPASSARTLHCPHEGGTLAIPLPPKPLARLRWALYLFVPALDVVSALADGQLGPPTQRPAPASPSFDPTAVQKLDALIALEKDPPAALAAWTQLIEDVTLRAELWQVWNVILHRHQGMLRTPYGLLVGHPELVKFVLENGNSFSVRGYFQRMQETFGGHYLGMDVEPKALVRDGVSDGYPAAIGEHGYCKSAEIPNQLISEISFDDSYQQALTLTRAFFARKLGEMEQRLEAAEQGHPLSPQHNSFNVEDLAREVVGQIAEARFGFPGGMTYQAELPETDSKARCPVDFHRVSQHVFGASPSPTVRELAKQRGAVIAQAARGKGRASTFGQQLEAAGYQGDFDSALVGAINGFAVSTSKTFVSVMYQWLESGQFWSLQRDVQLEPEHARPSQELRQLLQARLAAGMINLPVPDLLYRVTVEATQLASFPEFKPRVGETVVLSLSAAALVASSLDYLFGGTRGSGKATHACPGRNMAQGVLLGMTVGLLERASIARVRDLELTLR